MSSTNELSSLSYTNKDFNSIYVELLEYAKKISHKWDPSNSAESDPGVVLLKLCALIGDKNNYNIDKNILEAMPASVTQLPAARQVFEQCGYTMKYYRAAEGQVTFALKKIPAEVEDFFEDESNSSLKPDRLDLSGIFYEVPAFTMLTDVDASVVYTIKPTNTLLWSAQDQIFEVIEGVATEYTINNDPLITTSNLDYNNRLYFTDKNIAENGIFITNVGKNNYDDWQRVDNLEVQPPKTLCYKFGLTLDGSMCYIEFPEDFNYLFDEGISITYIKTDGANGNISARKLNEFYTTTKFNFKTSNSGVLDSCEVTSENVNIRNLLPINNGQDPQSIDDAYRSYKRVRNTFDTLVTLADYNNYLITTARISNGYVCDRTNDIQHTYTVQEIDNYVNVLKTHIENISRQVDGVYNEATVKFELNEPALTPYDLIVYALEPIGDITSNMTDDDAAQQFNKSFDLILNVNTIQKDTSRTIAQWIAEAKSLQHNFKEFDEERILMIRNKYQIKAHLIPRNSLSLVERHEVRHNVQTALYNAVNSKKLEFGTPVSYDLLYETINNADERIKAASVSYPEYETYAVYKNTDGKIVDLRIDSKSNKPDNEKLATLWQEFRTEILAKNILCGTTPLYDKDSTFAYGLNQSDPQIVTSVKTVTTNTNITGEIDRNTNYCEYKPVLKNESILLTAPNFIEEPNYPNFSSYVKVMYDFTGTDNIPANSKYELKDNDYIAFFWKSAESNEYYDYIKYDGSQGSLAKFISPSFAMPKQQGGMSIYGTSTSDDIHTIFRDLEPGIRKTTNLISSSPIKQYDSNGQVEKQFSNVSEFIKSLNKSSSTELHVLAGLNTINLFNSNRIQINNLTNGCKNVYWILNNNDNKINWSNTEDNTRKYTLKTGEYFLYTNDAKTTMYILGEGTLLEFEGNSDYSPANAKDWTLPKIDYNKLMLEGIDYIETWAVIQLSNSEKLYATEMQRQLIGPGNRLGIKLIDAEEFPNANKQKIEDEIIEQSYLNNEEVPLRGFELSYIDENGVYQQVEKLDSKTVFWSAQTILNIDMNSEEPQELFSHQSFAFDDATPISGSGNGYSSSSEENPTCVLSSADLNLVGGQNVDVRTYSIETNQYSPIDVLYYSVPVNKSGSDSEDISIAYQTNKFVVSVIGPKEVTNKEIPVDLPAGNYIIQITTNDDLAALDLSCDTPGLVNPLYESNVCYFYSITSENDINNKLKLTYMASKEHKEDKVSLLIQPLYKYTNTTLNDIDNNGEIDNNSDFEDEVLKKVFDLDTDKKFDCTYTPTDFLMIKNPLESTSFHNSRHFYNRFTIDMLSLKQDKDNSSIEVTTNIR